MVDEWTHVESRTEYENEWYKGGYDLVRQPDGSRKKYFWVEMPKAVVIVARYRDEVIFVEQYRPVIRHKQLELPAGLVEDDESMEDAAVRELKEETGFRSSRTELLQKYWVATGVLRHQRGIVYAGELEAGEEDLENNEYLSVKTVNVDEALRLARQPPTNDATVEGLLLARDEGLL